MLSHFFSRKPAEPDPDRFDRIAADGAVTYAQAKARHAALLNRVNAQVAQLGDSGGHLVPVPLCASACAPGPLADFLCLMQLDPFLRYNQFYAASDAPTAFILDTVVHDPKASSGVDADLVEIFGNAHALWADFKATEPEADPIRILTMRDYIRVQTSRIGAEIEARLYPHQRHLWRGFFAEPLRQVA